MKWVQLCGSLSILWYCLSLGLEWKLTFSSPVGHCWIFQICWHSECSTFTASSFRIWNSSTGIPSPPLALFVVMLPKAHLTLHSRMWVIIPLWLSVSWRSLQMWVCNSSHQEVKYILAHYNVACFVMIFLQYNMKTRWASSERRPPEPSGSSTVFLDTSMA